MGRFRLYTWWSLAGTNAVVLAILTGIWFADTDLSPWAVAVGVLTLAVTVAAIPTLLIRRLTAVAGFPWLTAVAGSMAAVGLATVMLGAGDDGLWSLPPAVMVSVIATYLPARGRLMVLVAAGVAAGAVGAITARTSDVDLAFGLLFPPGMVASIAWLTLGMLWAWNLAERLTRARHLAAELAAKDERLRFAADLHDIQGHHLQVIALKAELAARIAESDPSRAVTEMTSVQQLAIDALEDTRAVVRGYRRTTLEGEIANAAKVLAAADIDTRMEVEPVSNELSEPSRHLLGLVMREATTNVLRHSQARRAEVDYATCDGIARLRVRNDGATGPIAPGTGTGLTTLAERLTSAGGSLTWTHDEGRFVVVDSLPVDASTEATA